MHAAWHFWFAVSFGGESVLRKAGLGGIHPLTQRYGYRRIHWKVMYRVFLALI
ncbi:DUF3265 domain-containing protein, partial [Vibrio vulnificus]|nr:DUF3265 domain-containing protein [Vibrio vulnificus]EME0812657.1 DUF3265 domain-containing protein [Vibrio vulnificus]